MLPRPIPSFPDPMYLHVGENEGEVTLCVLQNFSPGREPCEVAVEGSLEYNTVYGYQQYTLPSDYHYTTIQCSSLHYTPLHSTTLHSTTLHYTPLHYTTPLTHLEHSIDTSIQSVSHQYQGKEAAKENKLSYKSLFSHICQESASAALVARSSM